MEKPRAYPSIKQHFPGNYYLFAISRGHHMNPYDFASLRECLYGDKNRLIDTIPGEDVHSYLMGWDIGVYETEIVLEDEKKSGGRTARVAITCFQDPRAIYHIPADEKFHDGINHHIFVLKGDYDRADLVDALCDMLA